MFRYTRHFPESFFLGLYLEKNKIKNVMGIGINIYGYYKLMKDLWIGEKDGDSF